MEEPIPPPPNGKFIINFFFILAYITIKFCVYV